jgi:hypothetical protein
LLRVPGNQKQNADSSAFSEQPLDVLPMFYVDDSSSRIELEITEWAVADYPDTSSADVTVTATLSTGIYTEQGMLDEVNSKLQAALDAASLTQGIQAWFYLSNTGPADGRYVLQLQPAVNPATHTHQVVVNFGADDSALPLLGYPSSGTQFVIVGNGGTVASQYLYPEHPATSVFIGKNALQIPFFYAETGAEQDTAPASGFAKIGGDDGEIIKYGSITDLTATVEGLYRLNVTARGAMGTAPREFFTEYSSDWTLATGDISVQFSTAIEDEHPLDAILKLATSTGSGHHGTYDTLIGRTAPPLNPDHFDLTQFAQARDQWPAPAVTMYMSKPRRLTDLASSWLAPFGRFLYATRRDGLYRIQVGEMKPALLSEQSATIDANATEFFDPARFKGGLSRVVNQIEVSPTWDPMAEKFTEDRIVSEHADSVQDYGRKGRIEWRLTGFRMSVQDAAVHVRNWAQRVFQRLARPYLVLEVTTGRRGLTVRPGDQVAVTVSGIPALDGTRGLQNRRAVVLQSSYTWETPIDGDGSTGARLVLAIEPEQKLSTYSPAGYVSAYDAGTPSVTVDPSAGLFASGETAADHFETGDKVIVFNGGNVATRDALTIVSVSGNVITLSATLSNATLVAGNTFIAADDWSIATTEQRNHAHIADASTPPVLPSSTESFKYV